MRDVKTVDLNKNTLEIQWQKTFDLPAPSGCHKSFLEKAIVWQQQAHKHGGLTSAEKRQLLGDNNKVNCNVQVGTRLVRVWQDKTHQVTVLQDGFFYNNKHWKSLSSIAKEITGTPWSGPVFFGLKK